MTGLEGLIRPRSVAVIGASRDIGKIGHAVLKNIIDGGFPQGKVYPVNPNADYILGLRCYPSIKDVPEVVDLAIITVPARIVPQALEECGQKGVKIAAIISSGFKEIGNIEGERRLVDIAKRYGIRILGPNIVGIVNMRVKLNATFIPYVPDKGNIALISQSGALAGALIAWAKLKGIGLIDVISIGNKADVDESDLLEILSSDEDVKAIALYIESVSNGRRFVRVAKEVARRKPIVIIKAGRSERGAKAIMSHTGSLAGLDIAYDAAIKQCGMIRADSIQSLFDYASSLSMLPDPIGENVVIVTNGGGAGIMTADACERYGIKLMDIPEDLIPKLKSFMPEFGSVLNPIDLTGMATEKEYEGAIRALLEDNRVHAIITIVCHSTLLSPKRIGELLIKLQEEFEYRKPILAVFIGGEECYEAMRLLMRNNIPSFDSPERAVSALSVKYRYLKYRDRVVGESLHVERDIHRAFEIINRAMSEGRSLTTYEASEVARLYGIPTVTKKVARDIDELLLLARDIGYPLVLEIESPDIIHKTEVGAIRVGIRNEQELVDAYEYMMSEVKRKVPNARIYGVTVRKYVESGVEVAIGMHRDEVFGPLLMFGSGGLTVELYRDVTFRLAGLTSIELDEMVKETKIYRVLEGYRDGKKDIDAVKKVIAAVNQLALDFEAISDIDINPLFVYDKGCIAFDVKILIKHR